MLILYFLVSLENFQCLECHEDVKLPGRAHQDMKCVDCHRTIRELPHDVPLTKVDCIMCHREEMGAYEIDPHERARRRGNLKAPDCKDCHGTHDIPFVLEKGSKLHPVDLDKFCITCHPSIMVPQKYHVILYPSQKCISCHGVKLSEIVKKSVHKKHECIDCHRIVFSLKPDKKHVKKTSSEDCGYCHRREFEEYKESIHGLALKEKVPAAQCWDCHGSHDIFYSFDKNSSVYYSNLSKTCGKCHSIPEFAEKWGIPIKNPYEMYEQGIHHEMILKGKKGASCSDCHGIHNIRSHTDIKSSIYKQNVPLTCSKCHKLEYEDYVKSNHFRAIRYGNFQAPSCIDCHSEHRILPPWNPLSPVYPINVPKTCTDCHESVRLYERYGIPVMELKDFLSSYHGIKLMAGNIKAANCASCHGNHSILPSDDPESPVNKKNLPQTCGKCHKGIAESVAIGPVHEVVSVKVAMVKKIVRIFYTLLILITIGGMIIYCFLDYLKKVREYRIDKFRNLEAKEVKNSRFSKIERRMHLIHIISFFILVYTGFAHHYPDNILFSFFVRIGDGALRAYLHRIAGTLMLMIFLLMFVLVIFTSSGREKFKRLIFNFKDLTDAINLFLYNLGIKKEKPELGHPFTFYEKFEFWALIWGTGIMGTTGIFLWFKNFFLNLFPAWLFEVFLIIHFYEAILATLSILVWHFYFTIFDPDVYPLNTYMFKDKVILLTYNINSENKKEG
ncbi:MAG: cytochrome c3 family protein [Candidatus Hydrothermales bacterium]